MFKFSQEYIRRIYSIKRKVKNIDRFQTLLQCIIRFEGGDWENKLKKKINTR